MNRAWMLGLCLCACTANPSEDASATGDARASLDVGIDSAQPHDSAPSDVSSDPSPDARASLDVVATLDAAIADAMNDGDVATAADARSDVPAAPVDLAQYWPSTGVAMRYVRADGADWAQYTFANASADFQRLYDAYYRQAQPGRVVSWTKTYGACTPTHGVLLFADDRSVIEVGDWFASAGCTPNVAFGYRRGGAPSGLFWSPPGGLTSTLSPAVECDVFRQNAPGDPYADSQHDAYSQVILVEQLATWTAPYGRDAGGVWRSGAGRTYTDVVRLMLYHGTRDPALQSGMRAPRRCAPPTYDPASADGRLYRSYSNYESYGLELYLARGVGIVRDALAFTESDYWGAANVCAGSIMRSSTAPPANWIGYLDAR